MIDDLALVGERRAAARRLLAQPVLTARADPEAFAAVRAHSDWLAQRFRRVLGYTLTVGADHARLAKAGPVAGTAPPLRDSGAPFSPRCYTYLALALAVAVEAGSELRLDRFAAEVAGAAAEAGIDADPADRSAERRAFAAALRHLVRRGVLDERDGSLAEFAAGGDPAAVLIGVDRGLARLALAHPPHAASGPAGYLGSAGAGPADSGGQGGDDAAGELALRRMLAERAVVYREELPPHQRGRLARHQWKAAAELADLLGTEPEVRAEGVALVHADPAADGIVLPAAGPAAALALAVLRDLCTRGRPATTPAHEAPVPAADLDGALAAAARLRPQWDRGTAEHVPDDAETGRRAVALLCAADLLRAPDEEGGPWFLRAAAARYALPARGGRGAGEPAEAAHEEPAGAGSGAAR